MRKTIKATRNIISIIIMLIGVAMLMGSVAWSGYNAYKFYTYKSVAEGVVTEYYSPIGAFPDYKWPRIEYNVGGITYEYNGKSEVSEKPYPEHMSLIVRYDSHMPQNAVTSLDFYDGLKFSAFGIVGAFIFFILARLFASNAKEEQYEINESERSSAERRIAYAENDSVNAFDTVKGRFNQLGEDLVYVLSPGEYASGWQHIEGEWYYFDPEAHRSAIRSRWAKLGGDIFCFDENGAVRKGWFGDGQNWFLLNSQEQNGRIGKLFTGWVQAGRGGALYYFNESDTTLPIGAMFVNRMAPGNIKVDKEGKYIPGSMNDVPPGTMTILA